MADEEAFLSSSESEQRVPITDYNTILDLKPKKYGQKTVVGEIRNVRQLTWLEWLFVIVGVITFLSTLGLTIERFVHFKSNYNDSHNASEGNDELDPCHSWTCLSDVAFGGLLVANIVFCFLYGLDGLLREKGFELLGVIGAIILIIVYLASNFIYHMVNKNEDNFSSRELAIRIVRLAIAVILGPILAIISLFIYFKLGKLTFTIVGGNRELMRAYKMVSFLSTLLFFNVQAVVSIIILAFVRQGTFLSEAEKIILPIMTFFVILFTPVGYIGILYESQIMTILFLVLISPTSVYYVFKIVDVAINFKAKYQFDKGMDNHYDFIGMTIIAICALALIFLILIGVFGVLVYRNFGKGLKEKIDLPFYWCYKKLTTEK